MEKEKEKDTTEVVLNMDVDFTANSPYTGKIQKKEWPNHLPISYTNGKIQQKPKESMNQTSVLQKSFEKPDQSSSQGQPVTGFRQFDPDTSDTNGMSVTVNVEQLSNDSGHTSGTATVKEGNQRSNGRSKNTYLVSGL